METIFWEDGAPVILDQTLLPAREDYLRIETVEAMAEAICRLGAGRAPHPRRGGGLRHGPFGAARRNAAAPDFLGAGARRPPAAHGYAAHGGQPVLGAGPGHGGDRGAYAAGGWPGAAEAARGHGGPDEARGRGRQPRHRRPRGRR